MYRNETTIILTRLFASTKNMSENVLDQTTTSVAILNLDIMTCKYDILQVVYSVSFLEIPKSFFVERGPGFNVGAFSVCTAYR